MIIDATLSATDNASIRELVDTLAECYGRTFIPASATWTQPMVDLGQHLARLCGVPYERSKALRPHELQAFYSVARKSPESAKRLAAKYGPLALPVAPVAPSVPPVAGMDSETVQAAIADAMTALAVDVLDASRASTDASLAYMYSTIPALVAEQVAALAPRAVQVQIASAPAVTINTAHPRLSFTLTCCANGIWPYLVGPAGSGKTTLAEQVAEAMGRDFYMAAKVQSEFTLLGFMNAAGTYVSTPFREAYEHGGVFLLDEMDASSASALAAFNAALANGHCPFPDKLVKRHKDFVCIGAGNTIGTGANRQYVGRAQLDAATLDRFAFVQVEYDDNIEAAMCPNKAWRDYVQAIRNYCDQNAIRAIVSPRASKSGNILLAAGETWTETAQALIFDKMDAPTVERIKSAVPAYAYDINPIL